MRTNFRNVVVIGAGLLFAAGCSNSEDDENTINVVGIWAAPAYGVALQIGADDYTYYQYTAASCQRFELFDEPYAELLDDVRVDAVTGTLQNSFFEMKAPAVSFDRLTTLPERCIDALVVNLGEQGYQRDALRDFDIFWQTFNDHYAFFDLKGVDWQAQRAVHRPRVEPGTSEAELFDVLADMITPLADGHNSLTSAVLQRDFSVTRKPDLEDKMRAEFDTLPDTQGTTFERYQEQQIDLIFKTVIASFENPDVLGISATENVIWSMLPDNIGYAAILGMAGYAQDANATPEADAVDAVFDRVLADLAGADAMILDLRLNGGGDDSTSLRIASRFTDERTLAYRKQARAGDTRLPLEDVFVEPSAQKRFLKPVVLLTSTGTASAAEVFILAMQAATSVRLVGEASAGEFSDMLPKSLPGSLAFSLSNEYYFDANGRAYEDVGVPVDLEVPVFTQADRQAGTDPGLMAARQLLMNEGY